MNFNFPENIQYCQLIVEEVSNVLYFSHIPSAIAGFLIGTLILYKSNFSLLGKILYSISLTFSLWVICNLLIWVFYFNNNLVMAAWAMIEVFALLLFILCLYFTYVFLNKKDAPFFLKLIAAVPLLGVILLSTTRYNITEYDIQECIAVENPIFTRTIFYLKIILSLWIIIFSIYKYFKADKKFKNQIMFLAIGILIFLLSFLVSGEIAGQTGEFVYEALGLLGMVIFVGFLGYLIVKYKTFNVEMIAAQALVLTIIFLTGAGIFFADGGFEFILTIFTFIFICSAGYFLTRSVKREIQQREKIEKLAVKLKVANDQLHELDREKDELLSMVSHQLATPITSIKWYLEMLMDGELGTLNKDQTEHVASMKPIADDLNDLVSMILDVSRIQLGKMRIEKQKLNLQKFFKEILDVIEPKAKQKNVNLKVEIPNNLPIAMLDKRYTRMTIENLLSNAVKYNSENGTVNLSVKLLKNNILSVIVKDSGVGIPKEDQAKIFGKLFRASNVRNAVDGNGFGLYVAKGAVEAQGGKIWFDSVEGKGTTFFIELPLGNA